MHIITNLILKKTYKNMLMTVYTLIKFKKQNINKWSNQD